MKGGPASYTGGAPVAPLVPEAPWPVADAPRCCIALLRRFLAPVIGVFNYLLHSSPLTNYRLQRDTREANTNGKRNGRSSKGDECGLGPVIPPLFLFISKSTLASSFQRPVHKYIVRNAEGRWNRRGRVNSLMHNAAVFPTHWLRR